MDIEILLRKAYAKLSSGDIDLDFLSYLSNVLKRNQVIQPEKHFPSNNIVYVVVVRDYFEYNFSIFLDREDAEFYAIEEMGKFNENDVILNFPMYEYEDPEEYIEEELNSDNFDEALTFLNRNLEDGYNINIIDTQIDFN